MRPPSLLPPLKSQYKITVFSHPHWMSVRNRGVVKKKNAQSALFLRAFFLGLYPVVKGRELEKKTSHMSRDSAI